MYEEKFTLFFFSPDSRVVNKLDVLVKKAKWDKYTGKRRELC